MTKLELDYQAKENLNLELITNPILDSKCMKSFSSVNRPEVKKDARAKVRGKATYTADHKGYEFLYGRVFRSKIAHGVVKSIDVEEAMKLPGVIKVITFNDFSDNRYPTCGHPYSLDPHHRDIADKPILTNHVRYYGDEIAAVVATDRLTARKALDLIKVEYEEISVVLEVKDAIKEDAVTVHECPNNVVAKTEYRIGTEIEESLATAKYIVEGAYKTRPVKHCHIENQACYAYEDENERIVVVAPTQIPHMCRRMLSEAFDMPLSKFRVIKPYVGGGFGNRQDVTIEPLTVALSLSVGGRPVMLEYDREELMIGTRTRHGVDFDIQTAVNGDGRITARTANILSNKGAYASHGAGPTNVMAANFIESYMDIENFRTEFTLAYTNLPVAGAMRAYGVPQMAFASEANIDDTALALGIDPLEFRLNNMTQENHINPQSDLHYSTIGTRAAIEKGRKLIGWDEKRMKYQNQNGVLRRGVGMSAFTFESGAWPFRLETGAARITLNQDGSVFLKLGAVDIGQGSDTVLSQIVAETIGIAYDKVLVDPVTDTDISPFDTGAYSTRQSFVSGQIVEETALAVREEILELVGRIKDIPSTQFTIENDLVIERSSRKPVMSVQEAAMHSYYSQNHARVISCEVSRPIDSNAVTTGVCFTEVEVDIQTGKVDVLKIINVHDCGTVLNPSTASGQVHGGMSMGLGYALSEVMLFDDSTGKPLNNNLLDYKLPTMLDTPTLNAEFVELADANGPYGAKGLGEPPTIPVAPAIRNAILHATGVKVNELPMNPQRLFERFSEAGLIKGVK